MKVCLAMDPNKRWSCEQLLDHPYFDNYLMETKREENKSKAYQAQNMFQSERKGKQDGEVVSIVDADLFRLFSYWCSLILDS